ncbi:MAG: lysine--tRNA ligase, partial [Streptococcaceae bacterium]|nr:lysine--tRNA ligase [Streptococcaceae bacterium]
MKVRREKMEKLRAEGIDPFGTKFVRTHDSAQLHEKYDANTKEELNELGLSATIAGRLMTKRG